MGKARVFEWFSRFKSGEISVDDRARSGRPSTARTDKNVEKLHEIILEDRRHRRKTYYEFSAETARIFIEFLKPMKPQQYQA